METVEEKPLKDKSRSGQASNVISKQIVNGSIVQQQNSGIKLRHSSIASNERSASKSHFSVAAQQMLSTVDS